jgi:ParB family chromosome partitioning protein
LDITLIELNKIKPNDYNPNVVPEDILAKLRAEIGQKGLTQPIIVRSRDNGYVIVDGYHRWLICRDLGWQKIPCIIQDFDDNEAKIKTLQLNYMRGSAVPVKLASLIHDLSKEIKLEDLAKWLPYETPQMMDSLELLKLPEDFGKELESKASQEEQELPSVISFVIYKEQLGIIEEALKIAIQELPEGTKNSKALALERICVDFLMQQRIKKKNDSSAEAG